MGISAPAPAVSMESKILSIWLRTLPTHGHLLTILERTCSLTESKSSTKSMTLLQCTNQATGIALEKTLARLSVRFSLVKKMVDAQSPLMSHGLVQPAT